MADTLVRTSKVSPTGSPVVILASILLLQPICVRVCVNFPPFALWIKMTSPTGPAIEIFIDHIRDSHRNGALIHDSTGFTFSEMDRGSPRPLEDERRKMRKRSPAPGTKRGSSLGVPLHRTHVLPEIVPGHGVLFGFCARTVCADQLTARPLALVV